MVDARLGRGTSVGVSVLSFGLALGVGQLVAGLLAPLSAPYQAVAAAVVRLAPAWLVEFGKSLAYPGLPAGVADKATLLVGVGVVVLLVAVLAGLAARRRVQPARRVLLAVGVVGLAAVATSPTFALLDVFAPLAALTAGWHCLGWLHSWALAAETERAVEAERPAAGCTEGRAAGRTEAPAAGRTEGLAAERTQAPAAEWTEGPAVGHTEASAACRTEAPAAERTQASAAGRTGGPGGSGARTGPSGDRAGWGRRAVLTAGAAVGAGLLGTLAGGGRGSVGVAPGGVAFPAAPPVPPGADFVAQGTPTFVTRNEDFYRIDTALRVPAISPADWSLRIHGLVDRELTLSYADLVARPMVTRPVTLACVSNEVGGDLISTSQFTGVDLREVLLAAGPKAGADQVLSTSEDGWTCGTPLDVLLEPDRGALLAVGMNGQPLPLEHGYPVRMVVPGLYGYVSATKWVVDLELTTFAEKQAYWLERGWAERAPIKTQARIDRPRAGEPMPAGRVVAAGIAWAQHRGVERVEVRVDRGPWQPAELATDVSRDTWRMWRATLDVPPGPHLLQARAADATGVWQTEIRASPVPDGASGYPEVSFLAR
ncbi:hypothetical protein GCM10023321_28760 [Pseudonocardia eucalypti]|uniref:Oxidoreductase molybdopterin-binding domain-containing protein n=1 Tax=Pseudonocardia eucalypti TaxID=648755 RepID=A0ABP9Q1N6_9PSEU|nr:DMSO/TMAO reductase YedYZ molybdopterin-dependent catalytic subunit [Pseudonocardia eucalypti]